MSVTSPAYAERASAAFADMDAQMLTDFTALTSPENPTATPPPATDASAATATDATGHGATTPEATTPEGAAANAATDDTPATEETGDKPLSPAEVKALVAAQKRASAEQSKAARELVTLRAELARVQAESERVRFDAQSLYQAQTEAKALAREQGGVRYDDLDSLQEKAVRDQSVLRQQEMIARQNMARQAEADTATAQQEIDRRTADATVAYKDAVADVLSAAAEAGIKLSRSQAEERVNATHSDPIITQDKDLWRDARTPYDVSRSRIAVVGKRMAELAIAGLTKEAIAQVEAERKPVPTFDRTQVHGESNGGASGKANLTYEQRKAAALADADETMWGEAKKNAPTITNFS